MVEAVAVLNALFYYFLGQIRKGTKAMTFKEENYEKKSN
jgi:hypothetical protein